MEILIIQLGVNARGLATRDQRRIAGPQVSIGRATDCGLRLPDPRVALSHAHIIVDEAGASVSADQGALRINRKAVTQARLAVGDQIDLGPYQLVVEQAPAGLPLALTVSLRQALAPTSGERLRQIGVRGARQFKRPLSYLALLSMLLLCLLVPLAPDLLGLPRIASSAANDIAAAAVASTAGAAAKPGSTAGGTVSGYHSNPHADPLEAKLRNVASRLLTTWNPGPVSQGHQIFGSDCAACHEQPFVQAQDDACKRCHERIGDHVQPASLTGPAGPAMRDTRCAECHRDHKGTHTAIRSQDQCADCHRNVKHVAANAASGNVTDFKTDHPAFRISLRDAATPDQVRRVRQASPTPADMVERSGLKFNHALHMDPAGVRDPEGKRDPRGMRDAQGKRTVLECGSCHQPAEGGRVMAPVSMEQHCQGCHSLAFEPSVTSRQAVHGKDAEVGTMLREFYARLVLGDVPPGVNPPDDFPRMRPGAVLEYDDRQRALAIADRKADDVQKELFGSRQVCGTCHEITRKPGQAGWAVAPVRVSRSWMPQAAFTHAKHASAQCSSCHDVSSSKKATDVAMPDIASCRECHVGAQAVAGKVRSDCATCHGYHGSAAPAGPSPHPLTPAKQAAGVRR